MTGLFSFFKRRRAKHGPPTVYLELREKVLSVTPEILNVPSTQPVLALLMETAYPEAVATLAALADGTASIYFSNGGGIIGSGSHSGPKTACMKLLSIAPHAMPELHHVDSCPLPVLGYTLFYAVTPTGIFGSSPALEENLGNNRHTLSPLFHVCHELITQIRIVDEQVSNQ